MALKMRGLQKFRSGLDQAIDRGTFRAAEHVRDLARDLAPVDEGDLRSSGRVEPGEPDGSAEYRVVFGGISGPNKFVDYAEYVEEGTPNSPAQPYLDPARRAIDVKTEVAAEIKALAGRSKA
jgi:hypothetical protein